MIVPNGCVKAEEYEAILQNPVHPVEQTLFQYPEITHTDKHSGF